MDRHTPIVDVSGRTVVNLPSVDIPPGFVRYCESNVAVRVPPQVNSVIVYFANVNQLFQVSDVRKIGMYLELKYELQSLNSE